MIFFANNCYTNVQRFKWYLELKIIQISGGRFIKAVSQFKDSKAAGPDLVKHIVLKNFTKDLKDRKCNLYTACITLGYTPEVWIKSKTIFIPKLGREDYSDPRSFSPISVMPFLLKQWKDWFFGKKIEKEIYKKAKTERLKNKNKQWYHCIGWQIKGFIVNFIFFLFFLFRSYLITLFWRDGITAWLKCTICLI